MSAITGEFPAGLQPYNRTALFTEKTIPAGLARHHSTKAGVWGLIRVIEGRLRYRILEPPVESILDPEHPGIVQPTQLHEVAALGPVRFFVEFYRDPATARPADAGHSEDQAAAQPGDAGHSEDEASAHE